MIDSFKKWLLKPYPLTSSNNIKLAISFSIGAFVFFFLLIFRPFSYSNFSHDELLYYSYLYAIISVLTILFGFFILPILFDTFFEPSKWKIYKEILFEITILLIIGFFNWIFSDYSTYYKPKSEYGILFFWISAFLIGFFPLLIFVFLIERKKYNKKQTIAQNVSSHKKINDKKHIPETIVIYGENKNEKITLKSDLLIYISFEKNYASIFYLEENQVKEKLVRVSLNKIEEQLIDFPFIIRCHKSYIINSYHVKNIEGNARNYLLNLSEIDFLIPVSRNFPRELLFTLLKK